VWARSFSTTLGLIVIAIGWLVSSQKARESLAGNATMRRLVLSGISVICVLHVVLQWTLQARSAAIARQIQDSYPDVVDAYAIDQSIVLGTGIIAILLFAILFVLVLQARGVHSAE